MIHLLLDKPENYDTAFIAQKIGVSMKEHYTRRTKPQLCGMFFACLCLMFKSHRNDIIVCWYDFQAVMCWWIGKLFFLRRKIICVNLLLKQKKTLKNHIASFLYKKALLSPNFKATVTSQKYGEWLNEKLKINVEYTLLHDIYHPYYEQTDKQKGKGVFCGGNSERDWDLMFLIAKRCKDVQFSFVVPDNIYHQYVGENLTNVRLLRKMPYADFKREICESAIVCFPLKNQSPEGLTVMFMAAANGKLILMSDTATTQEYLAENRGVLLPNDEEQWSQSIHQFMRNESEREVYTKNLLDFLVKECSEEKFVAILQRMIENENTYCK